MLTGIGKADPLAAVLIACGSWPKSSSRARSRVIALAAGLNIPLSDTQAGQLIDHYGSREGACDALSRMVAEKRRRARVVVRDRLPELYSFEEHHARFGKLTPSDQMTAFLALPAWQQTEAWLGLRGELARKRACETMAVAA